MSDILCDYCSRPTERVTGDVIYPHRPDLSEKRFIRCRPCRAYVGCHVGSGKPFGRLADADLRKWKIRAHAAMDPLWQSYHTGRGRARQAVYGFIASQLGIRKRDCHIGRFDAEQCKNVIEICEMPDIRSRIADRINEYTAKKFRAP